MSVRRFEFLMDPEGNGYHERIRVSFVAENPVTYVNLSVVSAFGIRVLATGAARLGSRDTWDTNAGMRIAFERLLKSRAAGLLPKQFVRALRRATQIELALDRTERKIASLERALERADAERVGLLGLRATGYMPAEPTPYRPATRTREFLRRMAPLGMDIEGIPGTDESGHLIKPESYKNINEHVPLDERLMAALDFSQIPKRDYTPADLPSMMIETAIPQGDGDSGPNQTGR